MISTDSSGACTVAIAGLGNVEDPNDAFTQVAQGLGAVQAYPFAGLDAANGVLAVATMQPGDQAYQTAQTAIYYALASNSGTVDILAYSGGAAAFTAVYQGLSSADKDRIGTILYVSPGANGLKSSLATNEATTMIRGNDSRDQAAMFGTYAPGIPTTPTNCAHFNFACLTNTPAATRAFDAMEAHGPCSPQATFQRGQNGVGGGSGLLGGTDWNAPPFGGSYQLWSPSVGSSEGESGFQLPWWIWVPGIGSIRPPSSQ